MICGCCTLKSLLQKPSKVHSLPQKDEMSGGTYDTLYFLVFFTLVYACLNGPLVHPPLINSGYIAGTELELTLHLGNKQTREKSEEIHGS